MGGTAGLLAGLGLMAIPGVGPVVAAGWLVSTLAGAAAGGAAGSVVGALTQAGVSKEDADIYVEGLRRGGVRLNTALAASGSSRSRRSRPARRVCWCLAILHSPAIAVSSQ